MAGQQAGHARHGSAVSQTSDGSVKHTMMSIDTTAFAASGDPAPLSAGVAALTLSPKVDGSSEHGFAPFSSGSPPRSASRGFHSLPAAVAETSPQERRPGPTTQPPAPSSGVSGLGLVQESANEAKRAAARDRSDSLLSHTGSVRSLTPSTGLRGSRTRSIVRRQRKFSVGYEPHVYPEKSTQQLRVEAWLRERGFIPEAQVAAEVDAFYNNLGIDDTYFLRESAETVGGHILRLYSAKIVSWVRHEALVEISLEHEAEDKSNAVLIHTSVPGISQIDGPQHERQLDERYLNESSASTEHGAYRVESFRADTSIPLRSYFISRCNFQNCSPDDTESRNIRAVSDSAFLSSATQNTLEIYERVMNQALCRSGPVIELFPIEDTDETRLVVAYQQHSAQYFFSAMSDLYHFYGFTTSRKYAEQFCNGVTVLSLYLTRSFDTPDGVDVTSRLEPNDALDQIIRGASLIYCLPSSPLAGLFQRAHLSVQETAYAHCAWLFAQHFTNRLGREYIRLSQALDPVNNSSHAEVLDALKSKLRTATFTRQHISEVICDYPSLIKELYHDFEKRHSITSNPELSRKKSDSNISGGQVAASDAWLSRIRKSVPEEEHQIFLAFDSFNKHILKTNFFQPTKVGLSFRLDPSFLPDIEYPTKPFGMFFVVTSEARGFHIRFRDVARGGIRIIQSRNREQYSLNLRSLVDENVNLAMTQTRKNKDIPEGGSKGTILLDFEHQDRARIAFEKYVDSILDLLLPGETPGVKDRIVDLYGKPEILYFGPDEGTASMMDWAALHAQSRGAPWWQAFTTGKSQSLGGIPHDLYGMTTRSVHQYVLGIARKLKIAEEDIIKGQVGGPDGDLGSNEIKISKDRTVFVIDGSGVLYDPEGLERTELNRLANSRLMISHFNMKFISARGFRVLVDESNVNLPDGTLVEDGFAFRNRFHLNPLARATFFVPCGGRPESINSINVHEVIDHSEDGKAISRFPYIVEGANLFITQAARLRLEKAGAIIIKDASANKGGVSSSSLEVLAALAFDDAGFREHMQVQNGKCPAFYEQYVKEVQAFIERNAAFEFECLWKAHQETQRPFSQLSDEVSLSILRMKEGLETSPLWSDVEGRRQVLGKALPAVLIKQLGLDAIIQRVPASYLQAIWSSYLASRTVYLYGLQPNPGHFTQSYLDIIRGQV